MLGHELAPERSSADASAGLVADEPACHGWRRPRTSASAAAVAERHHRAPRRQAHDGARSAPMASTSASAPRVLAGHLGRHGDGHALAKPRRGGRPHDPLERPAHRAHQLRLFAARLALADVLVDLDELRRLELAVEVRRPACRERSRHSCDRSCRHLACLARYSARLRSSRSGSAATSLRLAALSGAFFALHDAERERVVVQGSLQELAPAVQAAHHRADGAAHDLGDLLVGELLDVAEDDGQLELGGQRVERLLDLAARPGASAPAAPDRAAGASCSRSPSRRPADRRPGRRAPSARDHRGGTC